MGGAFIDAAILGVGRACPNHEKPGFAVPYRSIAVTQPAVRSMLS
jgi:hypothetical protein